MALKEAAVLFFAGDFRTVTVRGVLMRAVSFGRCRLWMLDVFFSFPFMPKPLLSTVLHFNASKVYKQSVYLMDVLNVEI